MVHVEVTSPDQAGGADHVTDRAESLRSATGGEVQRRYLGAAED